MITKLGMYLPMRGDLCVIRRDGATKQIISVWDKKNVITYAGAECVIKLLAPNAALGASVQEENQIKSMRFGVNNTSPQRTDLGLAEEALVLGVPTRIELVDANRLIGAAGTVEYTATLDVATGNGVTYREAGLFTRGTDDDPQLATGAAMFSRQVFPDQPKTVAVELEFRWRLTLTV